MYEWIMLGIGLVHSWLIWDGDILTLYALLGLVLPLFHKWRERSLLIAAALLIFVVPILGIWLFAKLGWAPHEHLFALSNAIGESFGADTSPENGLAWLRRDDLAGWLGEQPTAFSYPFGVPGADVDEGVAARVRAAGFSMKATWRHWLALSEWLLS